MYSVSIVLHTFQPRFEQLQAKKKELSGIRFLLDVITSPSTPQMKANLRLCKDGPMICGRIIAYKSSGGKHFFCNLTASLGCCQVADQGPCQGLDPRGPFQGVDRARAYLQVSVRITDCGLDCMAAFLVSLPEAVMRTGVVYGNNAPDPKGVSYLSMHNLSLTVTARVRLNQVNSGLIQVSRDVPALLGPCGPARGPTWTPRVGVKGQPHAHTPTHCKLRRNHPTGQCAPKTHA